MQELVEKLGIEWQSLLFQVINFLILLFVLRKFVYKPLIAVLEKRRQQVAESVTKAEEIDKRSQDAARDRDEIIKQAQMTGHGIRDKANTDADAIRSQKVAETKKEIEQLLKKAREQIQEEKGRALASVRKEAAGLITLASEKVLRAKLDEARDREFIEESMKDIFK